MNKIVLLLITLFCILNLQAQETETETTTYYLIRHAEKVRSNAKNKNPNLTEKGVDRAINWSKTFEHINFDYIYSTNYNRTVQTALPTAKRKNLEIRFYDPSDLFNEEFKALTKGKTVLIVGHSNTTPQFANKILATKKYSDIDDRNNSNLYILTISNTAISDILLKIE